VAIAEPFGSSNDIIMLRVDKSLLVGSRFTRKELVLEFDARDMSPLMGTGATYLVAPGTKKLRLGGFFVSSENATGWSAVQINEFPAKPTLDGSGITIQAAPDYNPPVYKKELPGTFVPGPGFKLQ
jgi:hypothetical protein